MILVGWFEFSQLQPFGNISYILIAKWRKLVNKKQPAQTSLQYDCLDAIEFLEIAFVADVHVF